MNDDLCLLVTLYRAPLEGNDVGGLVRCAIKIPHGLNRFEYPMTDADQIREMLPEHVKSIGPICDMEPIFEVVG